MKIANCILTLLALLIATPLCAQDELGKATESAITFAAQSVVQIDTIGGVMPKGKTRSTSPFSGTVVSDDGLILTASYNLIHQPASIFVRSIDEDGKDQRLNAEILARDESRNLTLLKIDQEGLMPIRFANTKEIRPGQRVIAIGKSISITDPNVSLGIVSAIDRIWSRATQTDAKISRLNYGAPLVDLSGQAIGILVPLSHSNPETGAGDQWYDSGIGFAAKIDPDSDSFQRLLDGESVKRGLAGITLEGGDENADPATVSFCLPSSPAGKSGLNVGDTILEAADQSIDRQVQFKHAIGPMYDGETLEVVVDRDGERLEFSIELADAIDPYLEPEIGVLLKLSDQDKAIVDFVFPGSPAAGILKGDDRVVAVNDVEVESVDELRKALSRLVVGDVCRLGIERSGEREEVEITLKQQMASLPATTPGRFEGQQRSFESIEIAVSEGSNKCFAFVPKNANAKGDEDGESDRPSPALLVWVPPPGPLDAKAMFAKFEKQCSGKDMLVLVPQSIDPQKWLPDETSVIAKAVERLAERTPLDRNRIAIAGKGPGGQMAMQVAFSNRGLFRGVTAIESELSTSLPNLQSLPSKRLRMMVIGDEDNDESFRFFREKGFAVFSDAEKRNGIGKVCDWLSLLDRL